MAVTNESSSPHKAQLTRKRSTTQMAQEAVGTAVAGTEEGRAAHAIHAETCARAAGGANINEALVDADDMDCRVQAGVKRHALNDHLRATGLQFMVDPGADASVEDSISRRV